MATSTVNEKQPLAPPEPPTFQWSHLWSQPIINPLNLKSYTLPLLNLNNPYSRSFHLSWLGFFAAFLSWFAFPPLIPEAIKSDLKLTTDQVANSNIVSLVATLGVRMCVGPLVDRFGPRLVMAGLLVLGAIPSGLAGLARDAKTLYVLRFFIGILGGTFVPCLAWTTVFFDKNCVGTANALVGGWGNMGGGATFAIMAGLYARLRDAGMTQHSAWRAAFGIIPVPILLGIAFLTVVFGQDHPAGKWSQRHTVPAAAVTTEDDSPGDTDLVDEKRVADDKSHDSKDIERGPAPEVYYVGPDGKSHLRADITPIDIAVNETLTVKSAIKILSSPLTWLPALAYLTTFGLELALDGAMANVLFGLFNKQMKGFNQTKAGYYTSVFGFLNIVTRPYGGYLGDVVYRYYGTAGKKYWTLFCGFAMGVGFLAGGLYLQNNHASPHPPSLPILMGVFSLAAIFSELGNGANFALVPHCNPRNNGVMTGLVGAFGNIGGIFFALVFRFQKAPGKAFWVIGSICIAINVLLMPIRAPK